MLLVYDNLGMYDSIPSLIILAISLTESEGWELLHEPMTPSSQNFFFWFVFSSRGLFENVIYV